MAGHPVILLVTPRADQAELWRTLLSARLSQVDFRVYPDIVDARSVTVALAWKAPHGVLAQLPNLRLICSLGMGVDHLLDDPTLPHNVPIARLVDPNMVEQMSEYALYGVLHFHRHFDIYERYQRERRWEELPLPHTAERRVGVMGLGEIGSDCALKLASLGFRVRGWSRTPKALQGVQCFSGGDGLTDFLAGSEILVVAIPLTRSTAGILDAGNLSRLPRGAFLVNMARGALVVESALLAALDSGQLGGAMLDVTEREPLPAESPLWLHPKVKVTPHIAGLTNPETAAEPIAENIRRLFRGEPVHDLIELERGY